jgi:Na+/H+ antiporter NhaD/arsenite permease-like protein
VAVAAPLWQQVTAGGIFVIAYVLIATDRFDRAKVALVGALAMLLLGLVSQREAFGASSVPGIDWNTIFLLLGMMVYVGALGQTGALQWLAIRCAKMARGEPVLILVALSVVTGVVSAALDNVTTVLLVAPVTLVLCEALDVNPVPMLIAEALASNIGGTATLVGDPPNILIGSTAGLTFTDFLLHLAPLVLVMLVGYAFYARAVWGGELVASEKRKATLLRFDESESIRDPRLLRTCIWVGVLVLVGFALHGRLGWEPATVALAGAVAVLVFARLPLDQAFRAVDWTTLFFLMGLFIMVGGLVKVGLVERLSGWVLLEFGGNTLLLALVVLWFSALASAVIDNIPYVATMCPLVSSLAVSITGLPAAEATRDPRVLPIWWALALGACLGGNATLVGASANIVVGGIAHKAGMRITFREFARYGVPVTLWTMALSTCYLVIRYF